MADLFEHPKRIETRQTVGLELSRTHRDVRAPEGSATFRRGFYIPTNSKRVSRAVGPVAPTGPTATPVDSILPLVEVYNG